VTKKEFVEIFYENGKFKTKKEAEEKLNALLESIGEALSKGEEVRFIGWGSFEVTERGERKYRSPQTGRIRTTKPKKAVKFKVGKGLADKVAKSRPRKKK